MKYRFLLLIIFLLPLISFGQTFQWVNYHQGEGETRIAGFINDDQGNQYVGITFLDSIDIDGTHYTASGYYDKAIILKQDKDSNVLWSQTINSSSYVEISCVSINSYGQVIVVAQANGGTLTFQGGSTLTMASYGAFIATFSANGAYIKSRKLFEATNSINSILSRTDKDDNLYFIYQTFGNTKVFDSIGSTNINYVTGLNYVFLKFSNSGALYKWNERFTTSFNFIDISVDRQFNVYLCGTVYTQFTFAGKSSGNLGSGSNMSGLTLVYDSSGSEKNFFLLKPISGQNACISSVIAYDTGSVFISGFFKGDSVQLGQNWYGQQHDSVYHLVAKCSISGQVSWIKMGDLPNGAFFGGYFGSSYMTSYMDSFVYLAIFQDQAWPASYDNTLITGTGDEFILKLDYLGNVLWSFKVPAYIAGMGTDSEKSFYFAGNYTGTINFGPFESTAIGTFNDIFIAKTTDYAIYRGDVYPGPYCAGDTIRIPYTKIGIYDTANYFIAELSDEDGKFLGGQRELGRIKSQDSGTIKGLLPLFSVASSAKYRIRVRSTKPQVQSFYKFDTLRLLVYSRDTANAGPDKIICKGDTITLKTFGGTKWRWSPGQWLEDSLYWKTQAIPDSTAEYTVYISDSSGCGVTDTDKVLISVRPELKINSTKVDTGVCIGNPVILGYNIPAGVTGYVYAWSPSTGLDDSTKLRPVATPLVNTVYTLIAIDTTSGCNCKRRDTINITINQKPKAGFKFIRDCYKDSASFTDTSIALSGTIATWKWFFGDGDSATIKNPKHFYNAAGTYNVMLTVISSKGCMDSVSKQVVINPAPNVIFNTADVCSGDSAVFINSTTISSGSITSVLWNFGDGATSTQNSPKHKYNKDTIFLVTLTATSNKGCVNSLTKNITIHPKPTALHFDKVICSMDSVRFTDFSTVTGDTIVAWSWNFGDTTISSLQNPVHLYKYPGTYQVKLVVNTNHCSDSITKQVTVLISPIANFSATDACLGSVNNYSDLSSISSGTITGRSWDFGDGFTSTQTNPIHSFADTGTHMVKLKVTASSGCTDSIIKAVKVWPMPKGGFISYIACDRHTVTFTDTSSVTSGIIQTYKWKFGDGDSSSLQNPVHTYKTSGTFNVNLNILTDHGCSVNIAKPVNAIVDTLRLNPVIDTITCIGQPLNFTAKATGSDSSDYIYSLFLISSGLVGQNHSGVFNVPASVLLTSVSFFELVVTDSCNNSDTTRFTVHSDSLKIFYISNDTIVCNGSQVNVSAFASAFGGSKGSPVYYMKKNGTILQSNSTGIFNVTVNSNDSYYIVAGDDCNLYADSALINLKVFDSLAFTIPQQDVYLCSGEAVTFKAITNKGSGTVNYLWMDATGTTLGTGDTLYLAPSTTQKIILKASDACSVIYDTIIAYEIPSVATTNLIVDVESGCAPLTVNFETPSFIYSNSELYEATWYYGDGDSLKQNFTKADNTLKSKHTFINPGVYKVEVKVKFKNGVTTCYVFDVTVEALVSPQITLSISPKKITLPKTQCTATVTTTNADSVLIDWNDGFTDNFNTNLSLIIQTHDYADTGHYVVTATAYNKMTCYVQTSSGIFHADTFTCYIPNAFTPNKDALNEVFAPALSYYRSYTMIIYNRWGEEIFNFNSATNCGTCPKGWSGEDFNSGTYVYQIRVVDNDNQKHTYKGTMMLLR